MKIEIHVMTGRESHTSYGGYGSVKLLVPDGEAEHHYRTDKSETDWDSQVLIGHGGKHGRWAPAILTLDGEQVIYVDGANTWKGRINKRGHGWFAVDPSAPEVAITTPGYAGNNLEVTGKLRQLSYQEQKERGLNPTIKSPMHLVVSTKETEPADR